MFRSGKTPTKVFIQANASGFSLSLAHLTKHLPLPLLSPLSSSSSSFSTFFPFLLVLLDTVSPYSKFLPFFPPNLLLLWLLATSFSFYSFRLLHPPSLPSSSSFFPCAWLLKKTDFVPKCVHWFMPNLKNEFSEWWDSGSLTEKTVKWSPVTYRGPLVFHLQRCNMEHACRDIGSTRRRKRTCF